jgi:hypothetical protein
MFCFAFHQPVRMRCSRTPPVAASLQLTLRLFSLFVIPGQSDSGYLDHGTPDLANFHNSFCSAALSLSLILISSLSTQCPLQGHLKAQGLPYPSSLTRIGSPQPWDQPLFIWDLRTLLMLLSPACHPPLLLFSSEDLSGFWSFPSLLLCEDSPIHPPIFHRSLSISFFIISFLSAPKVRRHPTKSAYGHLMGH